MVTLSPVKDVTRPEVLAHMRVGCLTGFLGWVMGGLVACLPLAALLAKARTGSLMERRPIDQ